MLYEERQCRMGIYEWTIDNNSEKKQLLLIYRKHHLLDRLVGGYTVINDLDVILSEGESYTVEFKESADKSLPSEVCAFANASGGRVFIGIDDSDRVVGTDVSNAARSRIQDTINKKEVTSC